MSEGPNKTMVGRMVGAVPPREKLSAASGVPNHHFLGGWKVFSEALLQLPGSAFPGWCVCFLQLERSSEHQGLKLRHLKHFPHLTCLILRVKITIMYSKHYYKGVQSGGMHRGR